MKITFINENNIYLNEIDQNITLKYLGTQRIYYYFIVGNGIDIQNPV